MFFALDLDMLIRLNSAAIVIIHQLFHVWMSHCCM